MRYLDKLEKIKYEDIPLWVAITSGMSESQLAALSDWMDENRIQNILYRDIERNGYIKRFIGRVRIGDTFLAKVSIEFVLWEELKEAYSKDFANFASDKIGMEDDYDYEK